MENIIKYLDSIDEMIFATAFRLKFRLKQARNVAIVFAVFLFGAPMILQHQGAAPAKVIWPNF